MEKIFEKIHVVKIVVWHKNYILMGKKKYGQDRGKMVLPGGKAKKDELSKFAANRELSEEVGLFALKMELQHRGHMIDGCQAIDFDVFFACLDDCFGSISESEELAKLSLFNVNLLPLKSTTRVFQKIHKDILSSNKYYFELLKVKSNINCVKNNLIENY